MSGNSTSKPKSRKAWQVAGFKIPRPYTSFPLSPHGSGKWQKKIHNRLFYFGAWAKRTAGQLVPVADYGWQNALKLYKAQADDLHAGRTPCPQNAESLTLRDLCNRFLTAKQNRMLAGELGSRMLSDYRETTDLLINSFGKHRFVSGLAPADFEKLRVEMARRWGPIRLGNTIVRVRSVFRFAESNRLIDRATHFGSEFKGPSKRVLRVHRAVQGTKMLEAPEVRKLLEAADTSLRAAILLAVNAGLGNSDIASLSLKHLDLERSWCNFPRGKTGIERRCPLWAETRDAVNKVLAERPTPHDPADTDIAMLQPNGKRWLWHTPKGRNDCLAVRFRQLLKRTGLYRPGISFYVLRHIHRTVSDGARDPVAANLIMGHADSSMAAIYREKIDDSRLQAVADHVHSWLFPPLPTVRLHQAGGVA